MSYRTLFTSLLFSFSLSVAASQYSFDYTSLCHNAYLHYLSLDLGEGNNLVRQELTAHPYNLMATFLADYDDCLLLMMNGDPRDYDQREEHMDNRIKLLSKGDPSSPWYRWCKAGIYFHWALVHIRFGENFHAATTFRKSYLLMKENSRLFPNFPQNKIFLGLQEAIVGTVPENYQWIASIFGLKGSVNRGIATLNSFINNTESSEPFRNEAIIFNCYLRYYLLSQHNEVWQFVSSSSFRVQNNMFNSFVKANIAINSRHAEAAIQTLDLAQRSENYKRFPILDYELGSAHLLRLDHDAPDFFNRYLARYRGNFFVKDTYQKLSLFYYLQGNLTKANFYREQIKKNGSKYADADKQAQRFAEQDDYPNVQVLKARLLSDGGYYREALEHLNQADPKQLNITDQLEYYFRMGRIYDELNEDQKAVKYYQTTISLGRRRQEHFAARSALQMGMMYERQGRMAEAVRSYEDCLSMKGHDYQSNIDQQAKAGVNRLTQR